MSIERIVIKNFRSIVHADIKPSALNVLVGKNDDGKSNVLRALDLFFNNRIAGEEIIWEENYSAYTPKRVNKADEIIIELFISPPKSFSDRREIIWTKKWRKEGPSYNHYCYFDKSPINRKTKVQTYLESIRYDYIPAIKGPEYFGDLLKKVHDMLNLTVETRIRHASDEFTKEININTKQISLDLAEKLSLDASIQLPSDLRDLFSKLDFTSKHGDKQFSLRQKGDGIRVRHIPIILKWLSDQANILGKAGKPKVFSIWGYEEPENNIEMQKAFELAGDFISLSQEIQIFITTHSPIFYSTIRDSEHFKGEVFQVSKDPEGQKSLINPISPENINVIDSSLGLMLLLEPHLVKYKRQIELIRTENDSLKSDISSIFVEGPTDKKVFESALELFYPEFSKKIKIACAQENGGGHAWVKDKIIAWQHNRCKSNCVGLFDTDSAASTSLREANDLIKNIKNRKAFCIKLQPDGPALDCLKSHINLSYSYEELMPLKCWKFAESKGWLVKRSSDELYQLVSAPPITITIKDHLDSMLPSEDHKLLVYNKINIEYKTKFANYIINQTDKDRKSALSHLKKTLGEVITKLNIDLQKP